MTTERYVRTDAEMIADRLLLAATRRASNMVAHMLRQLPHRYRHRPWKEALAILDDECQSIRIRLEND